MKLDFNTTHYVLRVLASDEISVHAVMDNQTAGMYSTYTSVTNALDDLFQRISRGGGRWGAIYERAMSGVVWLTLVRESATAPEFNNDKIGMLIAEGTPVQLYHELMPHLHMLRGA